MWRVFYGKEWKEHTTKERKTETKKSESNREGGVSTTTELGGTGTEPFILLLTFTNRRLDKKVPRCFLAHRRTITGADHVRTPSSGERLGWDIYDIVVTGERVCIRRLIENRTL